MTPLRTPTLLAVSVFAALYGPLAQANNDLPVLAETQTQAAEQADGLVIDREEIQSTPIANTDLSQLLKTKSAIAINNGTSSLRGGDLAPEEISLADARPHQTNYMIGGVTTNNIATFGGDDKAGNVTGHTSGYFVDTDLLESVEVMDHNIDAEYGGFTGGVINAEIRKPTDKFEVEYNYKMTDSSWNSDPELDGGHEDFDDASYGDGRYQPEYQKRFHNLFVGGPVADNHKLGLALSRKESDIPLNFNGKKSEQKQAIDNLFLTHLWQAGEWNISNELRYSNSSEEKFLNDNLQKNAGQEHSQYENEHSGMGITVTLARDFAIGEWETVLAYDQLEDKRSSDVDYFKTYFDFTTFNFSTLGSYGNQQQTQDSVKLKTVLRMTPLYWGDVRHTMKLGADIISQKAEGRYNGAFNSMIHQYRAEDNQVINNWSHFKDGSYDADADQYALFLTDQIEWDRLTVELGLRAERMELFDETVLAPRVKTSWDFDTDRTNRLTLGASRYYSGSLLAWALESQKDKLRSRYSGCTAINGDFSSTNPADYTCDESSQGQGYDLNEAETPYADEFSAGWALEFGNIAMNADYVLRQQRKGLSTIYDRDTERDNLHNNIESDSDIYSLKFKTIRPYEVLGGQLGAYLDMGYVDRTGSGSITPSYDDLNDLGSGQADEYVVLDGKLIKRSEMDTGSYNSDLTAALGLNMDWSQYGVKWSNLVNFEGGRDLTIYNGVEYHEINGVNTRVNALQSAEMEDYITWDSKLSWTPSGWMNQHATFGLNVTNVLNTQKKISTHGIQINDRDLTTSYNSKGREIWLTLTLRN